MEITKAIVSGHGIVEGSTSNNSRPCYKYIVHAIVITNERPKFDCEGMEVVMGETHFLNGLSIGNRFKATRELLTADAEGQTVALSRMSPVELEGLEILEE